MPTAQFGDQLVNWRSEGDAPILYLHGVPNSSAMWAPFLKVSGGVAPDLPGFGLSGKRGDTDYSFEALGRFVGEFADHLGMERVRLCMHDWGAVGLLWAMRAPERVERLVLIDAVPFLPGYRWHFVARQWRKRFVGEVAMGATTRAVTRRLLPEGMVDEVLDVFDQGTQRAILHLYRSAPEEALAAAGRASAAEGGGSKLGTLRCPALIVWGQDDPYIAPSFAQSYADALGGEARVEVAAGAGHWPWTERPDLVTMVTQYLGR